MKNFARKKSIQKIILALFVIVSINFIVPKRVSAAVNWGDVAGDLLKELVQLIDELGDVVMGAFNNFMLGADGIGSSMLDQEDDNLKDDSGSWLKEDLGKEPEEISNIESNYKVPNILYSP